MALRWTRSSAGWSNALVDLPIGPPGYDLIRARRAEALGSRLPPLLVAARRVAATVAQGVHGRRRVGQGDSFWQFRPCMSGDPVNPDRPWRQSARSAAVSHRTAGWCGKTEWDAAQTVYLWRDRLGPRWAGDRARRR